MTSRAQPAPLTSLAGGALHALGRTLRDWRLEVALVAVLAIVYVLLHRAAGAPFAAATLVLVVIVAGVAASRLPGLRRPFHAARVRRSLVHAFDAADGSSEPARAPRVRSVRRVPAGDLVSVRVARGHTVAELEHQAEQLAAAMRLHDVRVERDRADASRATVLLMRRDPFDSPESLPWPYLTGNRTGLEGALTPSATSTQPVAPPEISLWDPIPIGIDELGDVVTIELPESNLLLGGQPGAGKSTAMAIPIAAAALDPKAGVWLVDGKGGVDMTAWAPIARQFATTRDQAMTLLSEIHAGMERRLQELVARGLRKTPPGSGLQLLCVDELASFTATGNKQADEDFSVLLRDVVQRGRAAGVVCIAATQKPGADVVPSALRDLFGYRLALRSGTPQASDTILGAGRASAGADSSAIAGGQRGVGFLLADERPTRIRCFHLTDDDVLALVETAASVRLDQATRPDTTMPTTTT